MSEREPESSTEPEGSGNPDARRAPISAELRPFVDRSEAAEIDAVAERLRAARPKPDPEFREALGKALAARSSRTGANLSGTRLHAAVAGLAASGTALLLISYLVAR